MRSRLAPPSSRPIGASSRPIGGPVLRCSRFLACSRFPACAAGFLACAAGFLACGGSDPPPPPPPQPSASASAAHTAEPEPPPPPPPSRRDDSIADDYAMTNGDCNMLADKFDKLIVADGVAKIDPKLAEAKRHAAEEKIKTDAEKQAAGWGDGCRKSLVGRVTDPKRIKCALGSTDVKAFDKCLNP